MNRRNIDTIYQETMHCGIFSLILLPVMAGIWLWQRKKIPAAIIFCAQIALQLKMISKVFLVYRPDRKCPVCEAIIPEDSNFCPTCGFILHKDVWGIDEIVEFNEAEEQNMGFHNPDLVYRCIEEDVINGMF